MADITIHGQTYTGVNTVKYVNGANTYDLEKLILNGTVLFEKVQDLPAKKALSLMTWQDISTVCKAGKASEYWAVGDTKPITINGVSYNVVLIGFDHDDVTDSTSYGRSKAGATFNLLEVTDTKYKMATDEYSCDNWTLSTIRSSTLPTILSQLESDLRSVIVPVDKSYNIYSSSSPAYGTTSDSLFLLSTPEVGGSDTTDGTIYSYFSTTTNRSKKRRDGSSADWWLRSLYGYNNGYTFRRVLMSDILSSLLCTNSLPISFAFCV